MRGVTDRRHKFVEFPIFKTFAIFLQRESDIAWDPIISMQTVGKHCVVNKSDKFVHDIRTVQVINLALFVNVKT